MADPRTVAPATSILLTLGLICFPEPGLAQQPDSSASAAALKKLSIEQLMNLEVTSVSRRPERLAQAASAIQVITQQDIRRSGASSLPEALRLATNLQVAQVNSRDWAISARGFNSTTANKLLVLIDGRTVYTPLYSGVFWDVQEMPLADIDRIEVISGPGATLWGANAVNGVINVITKGAKDTQGFLLSGGSGTEQRGFGTVRYGGTLGSTAGGFVAMRRRCPAARTPPTTGTYGRVGSAWIGTRPSGTRSSCTAISMIAASRSPALPPTSRSAAATSWRSGRTRSPKSR